MRPATGFPRAAALPVRPGESSDAGTRDAGTTMVELLVTMVLLGIFSALFIAYAMPLQQTVRRETGTAATTDGLRRALLQLDKQVRWANAINTPVIAASGNQYVEYRWQKANGTGTQTLARCTQWQVNPTAATLRKREWNEGAAIPTTWTTVTTGIVASAAAPVFNLLEDDDTAGTTHIDYRHQVLAVNLTAAAGRPVQRSETEVTLTALNSPSSIAPDDPSLTVKAPVCSAAAAGMRL